MNLFFLQVLIDSVKIKDSLFRALQSAAPAPKVSFMGSCWKRGAYL